MNKTHSLILFFFICFAITYSQQKELSYYKQLNISNGLTHNGVTSIYKDSKGFLWIATYDGLNKYDGYKIKQYKNNHKKIILTSNRVRFLTEDNRGNLLIGTDNGLTIYNIETEQFTKIYSTPSKIIGREPIIGSIRIHPNTEEIICSTEGSGIYVYNKDFSFQGQYQFDVSIENKNWILSSIQLDSENYLYATSFQAIIFNIKTKKITAVNNPDLFNSNFIEKYDEDTFYIGTSAGGILFLDYEQVNQEYVFKTKGHYLKNEKIKCANVDNKNQLWLGRESKGVLRISDIEALVKNKAYSTKYFNDNSERLRISSIVNYEDKYALVGCYDKGVFLLDLKKNPFNINPVKHNCFISVVAKDHSSFYTEKSLNKWTLFDLKTSTYNEVDLKIPNKENFNIAYLDSKGNTWGFISKNKKEVLCRVKKGENSLEEILMLKDYKEIIEDNDGNLWLSSDKNILRIILSENQEIIRVDKLSDHELFKNNKYSPNRFLYADPSYDFLWIGDKTKGLIRINLNKNKPLKDLKIDFFTIDKNNANIISTNFVTCVIRLPNNDLWIGTEGSGICKVLNSDGIPKFIPYTEKDGLSNNVVKDILLDGEKDLWVTTNNGLNRFNLKDETFRNFTKDDGLPFEDFYFGSKALGNNNYVLVGDEEFCYFNSKDIIDSEKFPFLEFGEFTIYNKVINVNDTINGRVLLKNRLSDRAAINLNYDENVFSLEVIPLHYSNLKNHSIKYKLEPLNKNWVSLISGQNIIEFNGLQSGSYTLKVKASNSLKEWSSSKNLYIKIKSEFWKSNIAYIIYVLIGFFLMYVVFQIFYKIQKLNHNLEIEQLEMDNLKDSNESKLRFFSNIAHEIKTPVALISGPVEFLLEKINLGEPVDLLSKLKIVERQSNRISELIDQVRDFQQSDIQQLKMSYSSFDFNEFIQNLSLDFEFLAKRENKNLTINNLSGNKLYVNADKDKMEKIFNNLFSNSFKYTKAGDDIIVDYKKDGNSLIVSFKDTGKGIAPDDLPHIFERFYQSKRMTKEYIGGSGIGLAFSKKLVEMHYGYIHADSKLDVGTTLHLDLPIVDMNILYDKHVGEVLEKEEAFEENLKENILPAVDLSAIKFNNQFSEAKIFYAEDNLDLRNFVEEILSTFFNVTTFTNGAECLEAMQNDWPDLVLTDALMPELNGFELCRKIKDNIRTSHIPVVMLTACISDEEQIKGIDEGVDAYIKKPFNNQRLISTIESLLKNRKILKERFKADFPLELEKSSQSVKDVEFIEKLYVLMVENLDNKDLDMDQLAKQLYLNRTHFYQKVKEITDQTPYELLKDFRIKKAAEFLIRDKLTVNEVFVETGFKSRSHFSKVFKDKYGITPGQFVNKGLEDLENF